jgi:outer membrane receptor for ferrienterochelin and colicins
MIRARVTNRFRCSLSYAYTDTENEETGKDLTFVPEHTVSLVPSLELFDGRLNLSGTLSFSSRQFVDEANTETIDGSTTLDAKVKLALSPTASLSFEADNVFDSAEGRVTAWQTGRSYTAKMDLIF